ncbi:hypothetical protein Hanom_Chr02g00099601 [Helianthus anomalus]
MIMDFICICMCNNMNRCVGLVETFQMAVTPAICSTGETASFQCIYSTWRETFSLPRQFITTV